MYDFLRLIWSGQVKPAKDFGCSNLEIKELERLKEGHREKLVKMLNEEEMAVFLKYTDCENELTWVYFEDAFAEGVRYAARLFVEALG